MLCSGHTAQMGPMENIWGGARQPAPSDPFITDMCPPELLGTSESIQSLSPAAPTCERSGIFSFKEAQFLTPQA